MSLHNSYGTSSSNKAKRNVLSRKERIALMIKRGTWDTFLKEKNKVTGLPKTLVG